MNQYAKYLLWVKGYFFQKLSSEQTDKQRDITDVTTAIRQLSDKQCASDPFPTRLLKDNVDLLAPFITTLFNKSVAPGMFPAVFKSAYITPRLKKASLDPADTKSYRPTSNLPVLSKTLEGLVAHQLVEHLNLWRLLPDLQSAYRAHHSTETISPY